MSLIGVNVVVIFSVVVTGTVVIVVLVAAVVVTTVVGVAIGILVVVVVVFGGKVVGITVTSLNFNGGINLRLPTSAPPAALPAVKLVSLKRNTEKSLK